MEVFAGVKHSGLSLQSINFGCFGSVTLSIRTLSITTLSIMVFIDTQHNAILNVSFVIVILSVKLGVNMINVVILSVVAPGFSNEFLENVINFRSPHLLISKFDIFCSKNEFLSVTLFINLPKVHFTNVVG